MSEKAEVETIEVLNLEDLKGLPLTTQKVVNDLKDELNLKDLSVFNPIVKAMVEMEEIKKLKYIPDDKENAQAFTTNKVALGKFNASVGRAKTKLKAPYVSINKKIDLLTKTFKDRGVSVKEHLFKEFDELIKQQEADKAAKVAKKNKASIDKISDLSEEAVQQKLVITRMNLKSKLDKDLNGYVPDAVEKAKTFSKTALLKEIEELKELKDAGFTLEESEKECLLPEQQEEIISSFKTNIDSAIFILKTEYERPLETLPTPGEPVPVSYIENLDVVDETEVPNNPIGDMTAPSLTQSHPEYFKHAICNILTDAINSIWNLNPANEKEKNVLDGTVLGLQNTEKKIIDYLK